MGKNIYLISAEMNGDIVYKIGITKRTVDERIKDFKTGNVSNFFPLKVFKTDKYAHTIEKRLHDTFRDKRIDMDREWFMLEDEDINEFLPLCERFYQTFKALEEGNTYLQDRGIEFK